MNDTLRAVCAIAQFAVNVAVVVWVIRTALASRRRRKDAQAALKRKAALVDRLSDPVWAQAFTMLNSDLRKMGEQLARPEDFTVAYGWTGSACGRRICVKGMGHGGDCVV